jgi:uncharacterized cupredoxin-like copper-binding protein
MTKRATSPRLLGVFTEGARLGAGHAAIDPALNSGIVAAAHSMVATNDDKAQAIDIAAAIEFITERVRDGDLSDLEAILVGQAVALNIASTEMLARARKIGTADAVNTLAAAGMRAAAQSRAAIDSLVNLKNPRQVAFVKQANINNGGQQQVNNGGAAQSPFAPAHEATAPNKLLVEANASPILEPRAACRSGRGNQTLEAVEVRHRTTQHARKGNRGT